MPEIVCRITYDARRSSAADSGSNNNVVRSCCCRIDAGQPGVTGPSIAFFTAVALARRGRCK